MSLAASARREICSVCYFPFPNSWLALHLRDQYNIVTGAVKKLLFLWDVVGQRINQFDRNTQSFSFQFAEIS